MQLYKVIKNLLLYIDVYTTVAKQKMTDITIASP